MSKADTEREILEAIANTPDEASQIDIIMEKRRYFRPHKDSAFYPVVQEYLSSPSSNLEQVTKKLLSPIDEGILANHKDLDMMDLWYSIIHSAKRLPFRDTTSLNKLVALMKAIQAHRPPPTAARPDVYHNLGDFGMAARETMNDSPGYGSGYLLPELHAYANMIYFYALLTRENIANFWIYCIWEMRAALETLHQDDAPNQGHMPDTAVQQYNAHVPAAATWVFALGKQLYEREQDLTPKSPSQGNPGAGGSLWEGRAEFSKERWALWKKRFGEVAEMEGLSEEVRGIAKEAVDAMDKAEKE
jgi:hypothetical protein